MDQHLDQQDQENERVRLKEALGATIGRLETEANDRVAKRQNVEKRWLMDLRQFQGEYEPDIKAKLEKAEKSTLFINETRPKTNACEARLSDMLFPTDDRNWGIGATPVPELTKQAQSSLEAGEEALQGANESQEAGDSEAAKKQAEQAAAHYGNAKQLKAEMDEARKRAEAMQLEIDDQLTECSYSIHSRDAIRDACKIGTGITKGPIAAEDRTRRSWAKPADNGDSGYQLGFVEDSRPAIIWVDPWSFFPDPDARRIEESESTFERHLYTKKEMRGLAKQPGFDKDAIRRILTDKQTRPQPNYLAELRNISGESTAPMDGRYQVWEYRGPLGEEDMKDACRCLGKEDVLETIEADPLQEMNVVLWFCEGEVLKFGIHHLDSGEGIYSIFNLEKDESSIWGFGIPAVMRDPQKASAGAWRMMMDNAGLCARPQIEVDTSVIEPADDNYTLTSGKVWLRKQDAPAGKLGFHIHNIDSHQGELMAIIKLAAEAIDSSTNISVISQGEQGAHTTQTSGGMAMLMNAVNVVFRRMVKNFDDDITVPNIRRMYDWNMQFSDKEYIKGDFEVDARGTSVLLVREVQSQNLMALANMTAHPAIGPLLKAAPILRKLVQSMMIPADEVVITDEELKEKIAQETDSEPQQPPEMMVKQMDIEGRMQIAKIEQETALMIHADKMNISIEDLKTKLELASMVNASKERMFTAEVGVKSRFGDGI